MQVEHSQVMNVLFWKCVNLLSEDKTTITVALLCDRHCSQHFKWISA